MKNRQFEQISQIVFPQSKLRRARALPGGLSAGMMVLEVELADGRRGRQPSDHKLIIRSHQRPVVAENEFRLLKQISALGLAAPMPYHLDLSGRILATPYLVISYSEGEMVFAPTNLTDHICQLADQLAKIHAVNPGIVDLSFLPQGGYGCAELERPSMNVEFDEGRIRTALRAAGQLPPGNAAALLHGDFWPGNSLWQNGRLTAVIDWEDAQLGDPLIDLAQSRSEIVWIFGVEAMDTFTRRYQSLADLDYHQLPYRDLCAALRFLRLAGGDLAGFAAYFGGYGRADITEYTTHERVGFFITQALDKLAVEE